METCIIHGRLDHMSHTAAQGIAGARPRFKQGGSDPGILQAPGNKAIASTNVEQGPLCRETVQYGQDAVQAMPEPVAGFLDL